MKKKKIQLNLGCGVYWAKDFINVDNWIDEKLARKKKGIYGQAVIQPGSKFMKGDMLKLPFPDNYADYIECHDAIEHIPMMDVQTAVDEMYRVLKPGGKVLIVTVDFNDVARKWLENVDDMHFDMMKFIDEATTVYGRQITQGDFHRCPFTPFFMNFLMSKAGFKSPKIVIVKRGFGPPPGLLKAIKYGKNAKLKHNMLYGEAVK